MTDKNSTIQVYRVYIKAPAQAVWDAIIRPEWTQRYGYACPVQFDLKPGGRFSALASAGMEAHGMKGEIIVGEVIECDPPRRLVQTWHPVWDDVSAAEAHTRLTYEIKENQGGTCTLTLTHDVTGAPHVAGMVSGGGEPAQGGGGWPWVLSDLKTLLESGKSMAA